MDEQITLRNVLVKSTGAHVDICVMFHRPESVEQCRQDLLAKLQQKLGFEEDQVDHEALFIDYVRIVHPQDAQHCVDCLLGLCEKHDHVRSVTILPAHGEPVELYARDLIAA